MDIAQDGRATIERFFARDDQSAKKRALVAAQGVSIALWRDGQLVARWMRRGRSFEAAID